MSLISLRSWNCVRKGHGYIEDRHCDPRCSKRLLCLYVLQFCAVPRNPYSTFQYRSIYTCAAEICRAAILQRLCLGTIRQDLGEQIWRTSQHSLTFVNYQDQSLMRCVCGPGKINEIDPYARSGDHHIFFKKELNVLKESQSTIDLN
jgi:hypothetical protein